MKLHFQFVAGCIISILATSSRGNAQEWTRFRGPNGTGISTATTIPSQFSEGDYNWRVRLPGTGHSSPVIWGNRIFITSAEEDKGKRHELCLNSLDGKPLWTKTYDFKPYPHHEFNTCASSTPTVDKDNVYFLWATPDAVTIQAYTHEGKEVWKRDLGKLAIQHGIGTSPIVVSDVLIFGVYQEQEGPEGFLIGLDRRTGQTIWKKPRMTNQSASYATPLVYTPKDGPAEVIFASTAHGITSFDPKTGDSNWEIAKLFSVRTVASPVLANGVIFQVAGQGNGTKEAVAVTPGSKGGKAPVLVYKLPRGPAYVPTPLAIRDRIFAWGDGGIVTCLKASTGEQVWQERVGGGFFGSPICVNDKMYAMSVKGELDILEAADKFKEPVRIDLGEQSHASPAVSNGVLYLRTLSHLISVGGKKSH